jgi:subtilisin-like proprotein convertase family protein
VSNSIVLANAGTIADVDVFMDVNHTWMGDLDVTLTNEDAGITINLVTDDCEGGQNDMFASFNDEGTGFADCVAPVAVEGNLTPEEALSAFDTQAIAGTWTVNIVDDFPNADNGTWNEWCIYITAQ